MGVLCRLRRPERVGARADPGTRRGTGRRRRAHRWRRWGRADSRAPRGLRSSCAFVHVRDAGEPLSLHRLPRDRTAPGPRWRPNVDRLEQHLRTVRRAGEGGRADDRGHLPHVRRAPEGDPRFVTPPRASLKLYFHPFSSFCQKVLVALYENDVPFEPHLVDLGDVASSREFKRIWPIGRFPVLRDEVRGRTIPESTPIIEYLAQHHPGRTQLVPVDADLAWETRRWDRFFDLYVNVPMQKIVTDR